MTTAATKVFFCPLTTIFILPVLFSNVQASSKPDKAVVGTSWYGEITAEQPGASLLKSLLQTDAVRRLEHINQYGVIQLVESCGQHNESFSRLDHSLGVLYLLQRFGAPLEEQVSGLLHDVSHTAFSHVSDHLYSDSSNGNPNFHDSLFTDFLSTKMDILQLLDSYNLAVDEIKPDSPAFTRLERELPDLCADRIDYILQGAERRGVISRDQTNRILDALEFDEESTHWYLHDKEIALLLAKASITLNRTVFATAWGRMLYLWTADALRELIHSGELDLADLFYQKSDREIWDTMLKSENTHVTALMLKIQSAWRVVVEVNDPDQADGSFENLRCRIVDPRVLTENGWHRLTDLDHSFSALFEKELRRCKKLWRRTTGGTPTTDSNLQHSCIANPKHHHGIEGTKGTL